MYKVVFENKAGVHSWLKGFRALYRVVVKADRPLEGVRKIGSKSLNPKH